MGWKSTKTITRDKAIQLIMSRLLFCSDTELSNALDSLGFGDNSRLPYYGYNFSIGNDTDNDVELYSNEF